MCRACIQQWATVTNLCPLCKKKFSTIFTGKISVSVPDRIQSNNVDEDDDLAAIEALLAQEEQESFDIDDFIAPEEQLWDVRNSHRRRRRRLRLASGAELNNARLQEVSAPISEISRQAFRRRILSDDEDNDHNHSERREIKVSEDKSSEQQTEFGTNATSGFIESETSFISGYTERCRTPEYCGVQRDAMSDIQESPVYSWSRATQACSSPPSRNCQSIRSGEQSPYFSFPANAYSPVKRIPRMSIVQVFEDRIRQFGAE